MRDRLAGMQLSSLTQRGNNAQSSRNKAKFILKRNDSVMYPIALLTTQFEELES